MALEAARQLSDDPQSEISSYGLSNVKVERSLPLSVFSGPETAVEAQLIARKMDAMNKFTFEIFFQNLAEENSWTRHCFGNLETQIIIKPSSLNLPNQSHDQALMDQAQALEPTVGVGFRCLNLGREGSSGEFRCHGDELETHALNPSILNSVLRLLPMSLLSLRILAEYQLSSLASLTVSTGPQRASYGYFYTRVKPSSFGFVDSDGEIRQFDKVVSLKGIRHQAAKVLHQKPAMNPLFFQPVLLPDITTLSATETMHLERCAELLTHKWPMCDVKIDDVPQNCTTSILEAFGTANGEARQRFRSITCSSKPPDIISNRIRLVDGSDTSSKYHMIFTQDASAAVQLSDQLHPGGCLCIPKAHMQNLESNQSVSLEIVCDIIDLGLDLWLLLRKSTIPVPVCANRRIVMFMDQVRVPFLNALESNETVALEPVAVAHFCKQSGSTKFDAIVIDCPEKPVITTWTGAELLPWLQTLLKCAQSILWVTRNGHKTSFSNVGGSLLRTLQTEQPSLRISWLVTNDMADKNRGTFATQVEQAYARMIDGERELLRTAGDFGKEVLRYLPDDCLSAYAGLGLPQKVRSPLGEADYSLGFAAPGEPVILSHKASLTQTMSGEAIEILVDASVVDLTTLRIVNGKPNLVTSQPHSGLFFAGRVLHSQDPDFPPEARVVGWHPDHIHRNRVSAGSNHMCQYPSSIQPSQAALKYAIVAVAYCIVDGVARARPGETFLLDVQNPLLDAIKQACSRLGASVLSSYAGSSADFGITFHGPDGIRINDIPINITHYLCSDRGRAIVQQDWQKLAYTPLEVNEYDIANYKEAFDNTTQPYSTVLLHRNAATILDHVPIYNKEAHTFTKYASYIVIGGLGGLGRFICSWMIENGAKHITVISRSGAGTQESRVALSAMNASGASVQCIKADACDRKAISQVLCGIRSERLVKGIINLAMVLGDAPMATMTAEDWDRVLRVKIKSSWILHEETSQDALDFFILFSSIASVLGNRNQASYNIANASLNALAEYRQSLDLPGISVALGAMSKSSHAFDSAVLLDRSS